MQIIIRLLSYLLYPYCVWVILKHNTKEYANKKMIKIIAGKDYED